MALMSNQPTNQMVQLANTIKSIKSGNYRAAIDTMLKNNPQLSNQYNALLQSQQFGNNPKDIALNMLKMSGIDPQQFINMLK